MTTPNDAALAAICAATDAAFLRYTRSETETERAINRAVWHALASACSAAHRASLDASDAERDPDHKNPRNPVPFEPSLRWLKRTSPRNP